MQACNAFCHCGVINTYNIWFPQSRMFLWFPPTHWYQNISDNSLLSRINSNLKLVHIYSIWVFWHESFDGTHCRLLKRVGVIDWFMTVVSCMYATKWQYWNFWHNVTNGTSGCSKQFKVSTHFLSPEGWSPQWFHPMTSLGTPPWCSRSVPTPVLVLNLFIPLLFLLLEIPAQYSANYCIIHWKWMKYL